MENNNSSSIEQSQTLPGTPIDFNKVIEESKQNLAESTAPKRGRGRPPGTFKRKTDENPQSAQKTQSEGFKDVEAVVLQQNEIEPLATEIVKAPFDAVGWKTGIDITPTDDEAKAPTKYLSKLIECYLPDLDAKDPKKFNLIALVISYTLLALRKFRVFAVTAKNKKENELNQKSKPVEKNDEIVIPKDPQPRTLPTENIPASNLFNNRIM